MPATANGIDVLESPTPSDDLHVETSNEHKEHNTFTTTFKIIRYVGNNE
jgi:hypothetical protein